jgi:hypothetical protein
MSVERVGELILGFRSRARVADLPFARGHRSRGRQHRGLHVAATYFGVPPVGDVGAEYLQPALGDYVAAYEVPDPEGHSGRQGSRGELAHAAHQHRPPGQLRYRGTAHERR